MSDLFKNFLIGVFVVAALVVAVSMILFLEPKVGDGKKTLYVRFSNISGLSDGTRVTFAGKPVGEVEKINEVYNAREEPTDDLGRVYFYQLTLKIDSSIEVYNTDEITVQSMGLMGEKVVAIIPKAPPKGVVPKLVTDQVVYAYSVDPFENALHQVSTVAKRIDTMVADVNEWFNENRDELSQSVAYFSNALSQVDSLLTQANKENIIPTIKETIDVFKDDLELIRDALSEIEETNTVAKVNSALDNFNEALDSFNLDGKQILRNVNLITQDIADGTGSLGKFIKDDDFYLRVTAILSKVNTLMNDVNHYGILFQYDKHWQRMRTKRANLLESLDSPKEFRRYFESEMDTITTSLARINQLVEKADNEKEKQKIMSSEIFMKDFSTLLRQVKSLQDSLKLLNEELVDQMNEACGY